MRARMVLPVGMPPQAAKLPLMLVQGDWREAHDLATVTRLQGSPLERQMAVTILGTLARYQGDVEHAWEMVRELVPRGPSTEPEDGLFPYAIQMLRLAADLSLDAGDLHGARDWLGAHDRWLDWSGAVRGRAESMVLRSRLSQLSGDPAQAERWVSEALALATNPRQPMLLLDALSLLGRILTDAGRYDDARERLGEAHTLADALAAPYVRARSDVDLAELAVASGAATDAPSHLEEARRLAAGLGAAPLLAEIDRLDALLAERVETSLLTARETDVLRLVAEGMTDAEVARRLHISPRTVGQHLQSIYNKFGVSSRAAATRVAVEQRLV
jgi:DNA-binding CsgD family transcriptional regulator